MKCLQKVFIYDALHTGHETEELGKRGYLYTRQIRESFHSDEQAGKDISAAKKRAPLPSSTSTCPCTCACTCTCTCAYVHVHMYMCMCTMEKVAGWTRLGLAKSALFSRCSPGASLQLNQRLFTYSCCQFRCFSVTALPGTSVTKVTIPP